MSKLIRGFAARFSRTRHFGIQIRDKWVFQHYVVTPTVKLRWRNGKLGSGVQQLWIAVPTFSH